MPRKKKKITAAEAMARKMALPEPVGGVTRSPVPDTEPTPVQEPTTLPGWQGLAPSQIPGIIPREEAKGIQIAKSGTGEVTGIIVDGTYRRGTPSQVARWTAGTGGQAQVAGVAERAEREAGKVALEAEAGVEFKERQQEEIEAGLAEKFPERVDLTPEEKLAINIPVIREPTSVIAQLTEDFLGRKAAQLAKWTNPEMYKIKVENGMKDVILDEALTVHEAFGAIAEALPGGKFAVGFVAPHLQTPSKVIKDALSEISKSKSVAMALVEMTNVGMMEDELTEGVLAQFTEDVNRLERSIKQMVAYDPSLLSNPGSIAVLEAEIFDARIAFFRLETRFRLAEKNLAPATPEQLYKIMSELKRKKND